MLKLNLLPMNNATGLLKPLSLNYMAPVLVVNGIQYDLSEVPDGATVQHPIIQNCTRTGDNYELTIILPHGANAPHETRFPEPIEVTVNGDITLPIYDTTQWHAEVIV